MQPILTVTTPFFALVLLGYLAAHQRLLPASAIPGLNAYVLYFALPCLLFRFGASMPFARLIDPVLIGIYALCALLVVALTVVIALRRGVDLKNAAFGALVAAFPNSGFMGVPLLVALFGEAAAGPVIGTLLVDLFLTSTLCLALAQAHGQRSDGAAGAPMPTVIARSLRGAATNPQPGTSNGSISLNKAIFNASVTPQQIMNDVVLLAVPGLLIPGTGSADVAISLPNSITRLGVEDNFHIQAGVNGVSSLTSYTNTFYGPNPTVPGIPEPMTFVLMGAGLVGIAALRRRNG